MTHTKVNNNTLEVTKTIPREITPAKENVKQYEYTFLVTQKVAVEGDLANVITRHATELAAAQANVDEVVSLLAECAKLGIDGISDPIVSGSITP